MSNTPDRTLSIRLGPLKDRLERFENTTGIDGVTLGRNAIRACLDHFESGGIISFPFKLVPASPDNITPMPVAAEDAARYQTKKAAK